jgi:hypothetical protein
VGALLPRFKRIDRDLSFADALQDSDLKLGPTDE